MDPYAHLQEVMDPLRKPLLRNVIASLRLPAGSQGLDVGCGIGRQTALLAKAVGRRGHVTGLDASESLLAIAREWADQAGYARRVTFRQGDWAHLPFEASSFQWVWSADAVGYAARDPLAEMRELARVVRPGGRVFILVWSSQMLLPGFPALEARLNATPSGQAPFAPGASPDRHFLRLLGTLRAAGFVRARVGTYVHDASALLHADIREALTALLEMRWGNAQKFVSVEDWAHYQRLCLPDSPDFILNSPDYYAFFTYSIFSAMVPTGS